jgi:hypothetical protein
MADTEGLSCHQGLTGESRMKDFEMASRMLTMRGEFYPTGFMFVMLPSLDDASRVERSLLAHNIGGDDVMLLKSQDILEQLVPTAAQHNNTLPSVGSESAMVQRYRSLALEDHCALMIRAGSTDHTEEVMEVVRTVPFSLAEKYRFFVIEDLH